MPDGIAVEKSKFDSLLKRMIDTPPETFADVVAKPKPRKDGGVKRSAKRKATSANAKH